MDTHRTYYPIDRSERYRREAFGVSLLKLTAAIVALCLTFFVWFDGPAMERYEILVHIALPVCIVLPLINYRYLIVVPFIAFLPDLARAFGIASSHTVVILPLIFAAAFVPFIRRPKTALIAAYAACAIWASHLIVDARKYVITGNFGQYPWADLLLYALLLTVLGFLLARVVHFGDDHFKEGGYGRGNRSVRNRIPLRSGSSTATRRTEGAVSGAISRSQRSRTIEVTAPEETAEKFGVITAGAPSRSTDHELHFDSDGFIVGDLSSKKAFKSKIRGKKGS